MKKTVRDQDPIYNDCLIKWGTGPQLRQAQEECAELIVKINHVLRDKCTPDDVAEEVADCFLLLNQVSIIVDPRAVDRWVKIKKALIKKRLKGLKS